MTDYAVSLDELTKLLNGVAQSSDTMRTAADQMKSAQEADLGHKKLDGACEHFRSEWGEGISKLKKAADDVHEALEKISKQYGDAEQMLKQALTAQQKQGG
ncbi:hypothetical protein [Yinghuangia seranimata]|uniref:hypothetical protein n=1 Tax=Yinghuangia seranimata TaxID=408067 RepID=UPI00248C4AA9|nr:hypothetical protein [Yinghuangia seranimata]MDI2130692.1 hypothetical protein [Yinghuangia seranimata]